jgi:site-specific recombinase XerD
MISICLTWTCRKSEIKDFTFHDLRHTFASHLVMAGAVLTTVSKLFGHKDIKMTLRHAHLAPSHMINAVNLLDTVLSEKTKWA